MKTIIKAPTDCIYCSEFMTEIPAGIIDKKETGCGLTSLALEDNNPTIIAVPTIEVIKNKVAQYPNSRRQDTVFGYYAEKKISELKSYINNTLVPKIIVTYDSFSKIVEVVDTIKFRVVVDEFSDLLDAYSYRDKAIDSLLNSVSKFNYVSYISATPIKPEYYPKQLLGLDEYEIDWGSYQQITVTRKKTNKPYLNVCGIIEAYKNAGSQGLLMPNGDYSKTAYFFVNSVNSIVNIIDTARLKPSEVRVICANTKANQSKLDLFKIETALDPEKQFNFITSAAFKGCDFYSETGVIYIVSNVSNSNTLISIDTDIRQIAGRIRNSNNPFNKTIFHIYNTDNSLLDEEEFEKLIQQKINQTNNLLNLYNKGNDVEKQAFLVDYELNNKYSTNESNYLHINEDGELVFNYFRVINDRRRYEVSNNIYRNGCTIRDAYIKANFKLSENQTFELIENDKFLNKLTTNTFKDYCIEYINNKEARLYISDRYPLIAEAFIKLGADRMKALSYSKTKLVNELKLTRTDIKECIKQEVIRLFEINNIYTATEIKETLSDIYNRLMLKKTAKATDLEDYFILTKKSKRIDNKVIKVIEVVKTKV